MLTPVEQQPLYSVYFAPRGYVRMMNLGNLIAQRHLSTFDKLIGIIGDAGSGKSLLIRGMFPGIELTNDDNGVNVRPLPLLDVQDMGFYQLRAPVAILPALALAAWIAHRRGVHRLFAQGILVQG